MVRSALAGSRIRERRSSLGMRQVDLARAAGISASYLNLIEHNKRRIGGKLLIDLAEALAVPTTALSEGAEETLVAALGEAGRGDGAGNAEIAEIDQFVGRFPGWAGLVAEQYRHISVLEDRVQSLSDRIAHDPFLSENLHDILSTVTAIRSTSSILAKTPDIEEEWQKRFQGNIFDDSARLSETAQSLVSYFDTLSREESAAIAPTAALDGFMHARGYFVDELETGTAPDELAQALFGELPATAASARRRFSQYSHDAARLPLEHLAAAVKETGPDVQALCRSLDISPGCLFRRLAICAPRLGLEEMGVIEADMAGALIVIRPFTGFTVPNFGSACPLWPLFLAFAQPNQPVFRALRNRAGSTFHGYASAEPILRNSFSNAAGLKSTMLIRQADEASEDAVEIGSACRVCAKESCPSRREPSILGKGF